MWLSLLVCQGVKFVLFVFCCSHGLSPSWIQCWHLVVHLDVRVMRASFGASHFRLFGFNAHFMLFQRVCLVILRQFFFRDLSVCGCVSYRFFRVCVHPSYVAVFKFQELMFESCRCVFVRDVLLANGQDSSFDGVPVGYCLDEVAQREEKHTEGNKVRKKGENKRSSRTHGWLCGWDEACTNTRAMQCDVHQSTRVHCMKNDVWGVLFTPPVGCSRLLSAVNETYCKTFFLRIILMSSTSFWTCPNSTMKNLRKKGAIFDIGGKE